MAKNLQTVHWWIKLMGVNAIWPYLMFHIAKQTETECLSFLVKPKQIVTGVHK